MISRLLWTTVEPLDALQIFLKYSLIANWAFSTLGLAIIRQFEVVKDAWITKDVAAFSDASGGGFG
jgi:hypothetical protein